MRCLIVDDDESPRTLMERLVASAGHRVTAVRSGRDALAALCAHAFDVALVDLEMPGMNGAETIAQMRSLSPGIRVLVVSGHDDRHHVVDAFEAGADGYLLKDELADTLSRALQEVRAGHTPLSPSVASVMVRQWRQRRNTAPGPTIERRAVKLRLGLGTDKIPVLRKPTDSERTGGDDDDDLR